MTNSVHLNGNSCLRAVLEVDILVTTKEKAVQEEVLVTLENTRSSKEPLLVLKFLLESIILQIVSSNNGGTAAKQSRTIEAVNSPIIFSLDTVIEGEEVCLDFIPDAVRRS